MKSCHTNRLLAVVLACACQGAACAQLLLVPDAEPQRVFCGDERRISLVFSNSADEPVVTDLRARLVQTSSATAVTVGETTWKKLSLLPGQTVLEFATLDFPDVRAETRFLVQWLDRTNRIIGRTEVLAYPTNLLTDLKPLTGEKPIGLLDPHNQVKPLLKALALEFEDLEDAGFSSFSGRLAIVGPFASRETMPEGLVDRIAAFARKGGAVVWIQPPPLERDQKLMPTFYTVPLGNGAVVVAQAELVSGLADNPLAQRNLIHLAEYAVRQEPLRLPGQTP